MTGDTRGQRDYGTAGLRDSSQRLEIRDQGTREQRSREQSWVTGRTEHPPWAIGDLIAEKRAFPALTELERGTRGVDFKRWPNRALRVLSVRVAGMTVVVVTTMATCGEHWARNHQQESYNKNLLHGKHPSTLRFPADRCCNTNVPKEKRGEVATGAG